MEKQEQTNWCWAAVSVSLYNFLTPDPSAGADGILTQSALASRVMQKQLGSAVNCSLPETGSTVCNQPEALDVALTITRNLQTNGFLEDTYLSFASLQKWVDAQLPVCARILWQDGGAHFIALDGCSLTSSGQQLVHVQNPSATIPPSLWNYAALVEYYENFGQWQDTYLLTQ